MLEMFRIRREQAEGYRMHLLESFADRAIAHLRRQLPGPTAPFTDTELASRVLQCIERCIPYGLATEHQIMCFVHASFLLGEEFNNDPAYDWPRPLLDHAELPAEKKAALLLEGAYVTYRMRQSRR